MAKVGGPYPNNATDPAGLKEKDVTLQVALQARLQLQRKGYPVLLTRESDQNLGLKDRAAIAKQHQAKVFIPLHFNGNTSPSVQGTEVWVYSGCLEGSKRLGALLDQSLVATTSYRDRGLKSAEYGVLNLTNHAPETACCLAEISFMTQPTEESRLETSMYVARIGAALAESVDLFLGRKARGPVPEVVPGVPEDIANQ